MAQLSREDYRKLKSFSKEDMTKWLNYRDNIIYNELRKEFESQYQDEINCSIENFLIAIWYTVHGSEEIHLQNDELNSFMEDLYATVDMFRTGEYKPEEFKELMEQDGIEFKPHDYTRIFRNKEGKYQRINNEVKEFVKDWMEHRKGATINAEELELIIKKLEVE